MNGQHILNQTKRSRKITGGPEFNLQFMNNSNTNQTNSARTMVTPRLYRMGLLSLSRPYILKSHKDGNPTAQSYKNKVYQETNDFQNRG